MTHLKSVDQKILEGTFNNGRENNKPEHESVKLRMPSKLSPAIKKEWKNLIPLLEISGHVNNLDITLVLMFCSAVSKLKEVESALPDKVEDWTMTTEKGWVSLNPLVGLRLKLVAEVSSLAKSLGLSPNSRTMLAAQIKSTNNAPNEFGKF